MANRLAVDFDRMSAEFKGPCRVWSKVGKMIYGCMQLVDVEENGFCSLVLTKLGKTHRKRVILSEQDLDVLRRNGC